MLNFKSISMPVARKRFVCPSKSRISIPARLAIAIVSTVAACGAAWSQATNRLEKVEATPLAGDQVELRLTLSDAAPQPVVFDVDNPARISLDLPDTTIALPARRIDVKRGSVDAVTAAEL